MKTQTIEFTAAEFSAFALVGETQEDGAALLAQRIAAHAAQAQQQRDQSTLNLFASEPTNSHDPR